MIILNKDKFTSLELSILSFMIFSNSLSIIIINLFKEEDFDFLKNKHIDTSLYYL